MLRTMMRRGMIVIAGALIQFACESPSMPPPQSVTTYDAVELSTLVGDSKRFHGVPVQVTGVVRLEFEGNALYVDSAAYVKRDATKAVWLAVGWPPQRGSVELNGRRVVVEGTVDAHAKGHEGVFSGSLVQIRRLEPAP